jgi:TIR domain
MAISVHLCNIDSTMRVPYTAYASAGSTGMPDRIFISYRRQDTQQAAGRLFDRLVAEFGKDDVFIDIDRIPPGVDFAEYVNDRLKYCEITLVLIGRNWLNFGGASRWLFGRNRLHAEDDLVRLEIETSLRRGISVIPVLIDDAMMPALKDLPPSIRPLVYRSAAKLRHDRFGADFAGLCEILRVKLADPKVDLPLTREQARLFVTLGYLLAKFEVCNGVTFESAKAEIPDLLAEIQSLCDYAHIPVSTDNADPIKLIKQVLRILSVRNLAMHAGVLVGVTIARLTLTKTSATQEQHDDLLKLARSTMSDIDPGTVRNKETLFTELYDSDCSANAGADLLMSHLS